MLTQQYLQGTVHVKLTHLYVLFWVEPRSSHVDQVHHTASSDLALSDCTYVPPFVSALPLTN